MVQFGPQPLINAGIRLASNIASRKGAAYRSKKLYNIALDFANIRFIPASSRFDWISSDKEEVKKHLNDEKVNFIFTTAGFIDLFHLVSLANSRMVSKTIPKELPILFMSGCKDPIGENGLGVKRAYELYKNIGIKDTEIKLYKDDRHELLNELNKKEVYEDILKWLEKVV